MTFVRSFVDKEEGTQVEGTKLAGSRRQCYTSSVMAKVNFSSEIKLKHKDGTESYKHVSPQMHRNTHMPLPIIVLTLKIQHRTHPCSVFRSKRTSRSTTT